MGDFWFWAIFTPLREMVNWRAAELSVPAK